MSLQRMSDEDLRKFVVDYLRGEIFTSQNFPPNTPPQHITLCFMVLRFMEPRELERLADAGVVWEYMREALPGRSMNGAPIFYSCRFMHKGDWSRARAAILRELDRQKEIAV